MTKEKALIVYIVCHQFRAGGHCVDTEMAELVRKAMTKASEVLREHGTIAPTPERGESYNTFIERLVEGEDLEPRPEGIGEHVAIGVMNPNGLKKTELTTDPVDDIADQVSAALEERGADPESVVVTEHEVDYGPDAPIQQEVVGVVLDSKIIPKDNVLHKLVKDREEDVRRGRIVPTSADDLGSDVPPFMRGKKRLPP